MTSTQYELTKKWLAQFQAARAQLPGHDLPGHQLLSKLLRSAMDSVIEELSQDIYRHETLQRYKHPECEKAQKDSPPRG